MTEHGDTGRNSLESTCRSPAPTRGRHRDAMEATPMCRAAEEAARQEKLYKKVVLLHYLLGDEEMRRAMEEPTGWRPKLPNLSLETQIYIL